MRISFFTKNVKLTRGKKMENLYKLEQELALLSDSEILLKFTEDSIRIEKSNMSDFKIKVQKDAISKFLKS